MSEAIRTIVKTVETPQMRQATALADVETSIAENAQGVKQALTIVQLLQEKGLLDMTQALLEQSGEILTIVVGQAKQPQYATGFKNLLGLVQLLGAVDVSLISSLLAGVSKAKERVESGEAPQVNGLFEMLGALQEPAVKRALSFLVEALRNIGADLEIK